VFRRHSPRPFFSGNHTSDVPSFPCRRCPCNESSVAMRFRRLDSRPLYISFSSTLSVAAISSTDQDLGHSEFSMSASTTDYLLPRGLSLSEILFPHSSLNTSLHSGNFSVQTMLDPMNRVSHIVVCPLSSTAVGCLNVSGSFTPSRQNQLNTATILR